MRCKALLFAILLAVGAASPAELRGQVAAGADRAALEAYVRVVANHFQVDEREVRLLAEDPLTPDEVPVVLLLSRETGISPAALLAIRRGGSRWIDIGRRYGVNARVFHLTMDEEAVDESLERAYRAFRDTPESAWGRIDLSDEEVLTLTNLAVLARELDLPAGEILRARGAAGSFVEALRHLAGST